MVGFLTQTVVASAQQKRIAELYSVPAIPLAKCINKNVPENSSLIYASDEFDRSLFLVELLALRKSSMHLSSDETHVKKIIQSIIKYYPREKYILAPKHFKISQGAIDSCGKYNLFKIKKTK